MKEPLYIPILLNVIENERLKRRKKNVKIPIKRSNISKLKVLAVSETLDSVQEKDPFLLVPYYLKECGEFEKTGSHREEVSHKTFRPN